MKKILSFFIFVFAFTLCKASNEPSVLVINLTDGSTKEFVLADKPRITFDSEKIFVNSNDIFFVEYSGVEKFYFKVPNSSGGGDIPTAIDNTNDDNNLFKFTFIDGQHINIIGLEDNDKVQVYSVSGMKVVPVIDSIDNTVNIDLGTLPQGAYIIKTKSQSFKVYKK